MLLNLKQCEVKVIFYKKSPRENMFHSDYSMAYGCKFAILQYVIRFSVYIFLFQIQKL